MSLLKFVLLAQLFPYWFHYNPFFSRRYVIDRFDDCIWIQGNGINACTDQKFTEFWVYWRTLSTDTDSHTFLVGTIDNLFYCSFQCFISFIEVTLFPSTSESRSAPITNWVKSLEPIENASQCSANSSIMNTTAGTSAIKYNLKSLLR